MLQNFEEIFKTHSFGRINTVYQNVVLLQDRVPFAVVGSNAVVEAQGKRVRGRIYPWGIVEGKLNQCTCILKIYCCGKS